MTTSLDAALGVLRRDGVVAAATESLFGLLADATSPAAVARVAALKPRSDKAFPLILPNRECWTSVAAEIPALALALADAFWPGPLTLAVPARASLDAHLVEGGTVAVRLPAASPAARLSAAFGRPLTATSANPSGSPPTADAREVRRSFAAELAAGKLFVVDEPAPGGPPSTVVVVRGEAFELVREGAIDAERIARVVESARSGRQMR